MSTQTLAVIAILVAMPIASQIERAPASSSGAITLADPGGCSLSLQGDQPMLATTITVTGGTDVTVAVSPGGGMPTVSAMAINTKGTGATNNGRSVSPGQSCATRPSPGATLDGSMRSAAPVASCAMSADGSSASVSVPLSAFGVGTQTYRGHVSLIKRGADTVAALSRDGWSAPVVVAACSASGRKGNWDLAVSKKA